MKNVAIFGITPETRLKLKLLATAHGVTMSQFLTNLVDEAYEKDTSPVTKEIRKKIRRIIKKWA